MIDQELLEILVCPETHQSIKLADTTVLAELNRRIQSGEIVNRGGVAVDTPLDGALVREDGQVIYPIREAIPIMLIDESIEWDTGNDVGVPVSSKL